MKMPDTSKWSPLRRATFMATAAPLLLGLLAIGALFVAVLWLVLSPVLFFVFGWLDKIGRRRKNHGTMRVDGNIRWAP